MNAAELLARALKQAGVTTVFGIPSYVGMPMLDAFDANKLTVLLDSHEQNAVHMAEGYWRATNTLPVIAVAIGPGLTNALTGIANAYVESVPMVVVAATAASAFRGRNEYHANTGIGRSLDERQMLQSCTKEVFYVTHVHQLPHLIYDAIRTATSGRPGPVFVSLPFELQKMEVEVSEVLSPASYSASNSIVVHDTDLARLTELWNTAKKPVVVFGTEISPIDAELLEKFLSGNAPYFTTYGGKGKVPLLPNYLGTSWYCNSDHVAAAVDKADLMLAFGEQFSHFSSRLFGTHAIKKPLIQISEFPEEIGRTFNVTLGIQGRVKDVLSRIELAKKPWHVTNKQALDVKKSFATLAFIRQLGALAPDTAVFFADVGNAGYAAITDLELTSGQDFYTTGKFGVCGWSVPTAIGFSCGNAGRPVFSIVGDLSLVMNSQALVEAQKYGQSVTFLVFNNGVPQNITQDQLEVLGKTVQADLPTIDYAALAKAYGLSYVRVTSFEDAKQFFADTDFKRSKTLVEIVVAKDDYPLDG